MSGSPRTFQKVLSALILSCGLASINQSVLVSVISEMAIARRQINRSKKVCKRKTTWARQVPTIEYTRHCIEHDRKCEQGICFGRRTEIKKCTGFLEVPTRFTNLPSLLSASLLQMSFPEQNDLSAFALVRRLKGTKHEFQGEWEINGKNTPGFIESKNPQELQNNKSERSSNSKPTNKAKETVTGRGQIKAIPLPTRK